MCFAMYSTRISALKVIYTSKVGHAMLHDMAEHEHCAENFDFLDAAEAWAALPDDTRGLDAAKHIVATYIGDSAATPVNLPGKVIKTIVEGVGAASAAGRDTLQPDFFDAAKVEILKMVEKDLFSRFQRMKPARKSTAAAPRPISL